MITQTQHWVEDVTPEQTTKDDARMTNQLPILLRLLGAAALLIAMYSFLVKGWQSGNDVFRYLLMLGHTGALAAIGLASGHWLKESKGARLLLTLALVSVPVNFAILGAFIYSQTPAIDVSHYPHYIAWTAGSLQNALLTSAGAMVVLVPITVLGFTVLARSLSKKLSWLFLLSNAILLLPLRDPQWIALVALALAGVTLFFTYKTAAEHTTAKTQEGVTALALQLLPLAVLTGRSLWLYSLDLWLVTVMAITLFIIMRQISLYLQPGSLPREVLDGLSLLPALSVTLCLSAALYDAMTFPAALALPIGALTSAAMVYDISRRNQRKAGIYRHIGAWGLTLSLVANLTVFDNLLAMLACVITGLALLMGGYQAQQRSLFSAGLVLLTIGVLRQCYALVLHFNLGSWASLAALGIASILVASTLEARGGRIKLHLDNWKVRLRQWEK